MIHHDQPPQQRRLNVQRRLQRPDAQAARHAQDGIPGHRGGGVEVPRDGAETRLVEVVRGGDEGDEGEERGGGEAVGVGGGGEAVDRRADGGAAEPGGELGGLWRSVGYVDGNSGGEGRTYHL